MKLSDEKRAFFGVIEGNSYQLFCFTKLKKATVREPFVFFKGFSTKKLKKLEKDLPLRIFLEAEGKDYYVSSYEKAIKGEKFPETILLKDLSGYIKSGKKYLEDEWKKIYGEALFKLKEKCEKARAEGD